MILSVIQILILTGIVTVAFLALKSRDLLASVIYLAAMSLMLAAEFYILQAPDVAIAEAAIGAGLATAIYIIAIKRTERFEQKDD